jgi:hypothetical protein
LLAWLLAVLVCITALDRLLLVLALLAWAVAQD